KGKEPQKLGRSTDWNIVPEPILPLSEHERQIIQIQFDRIGVCSRVGYPKTWCSSSLIGQLIFAVQAIPYTDLLQPTLFSAYILERVLSVYVEAQFWKQHVYLSRTQVLVVSCTHRQAERRIRECLAIIDA